MMLMAERQLKILGMIQDNGSVQVDELARKLDVSPMTIRRDLEKLQKDGPVSYTHLAPDDRYEPIDMDHFEFGKVSGMCGKAAYEYIACL